MLTASKEKGHSQNGQRGTPEIPTNEHLPYEQDVDLGQCPRRYRGAAHD